MLSPREAVLSWIINLMCKLPGGVCDVAQRGSEAGFWFSLFVIIADQEHNNCGEAQVM